MRKLQSNQDDMNSKNQALPGLGPGANSVRALWSMAKSLRIHKRDGSSPDTASLFSQLESAFWAVSWQSQLIDTVSLPLPELNSNHSAQP